VGIPLTVGFRPQLVVSGLFGGNPFDGGIWATTCCCLRPFRWESLWWWDLGFHGSLWLLWSPFTNFFSYIMEFRLSSSLSQIFLSRWNSGYHEAFHTNFSFLRWSPGYYESFHTNFCMMESCLSQSLSTSIPFIWWDLRLSRSLFTNFSLTRWNLGYHEAFSWIFLWHNGISAITEPFHKFFFDTMESRLLQSLFTNFSLTRWNLVYHGAFSRIFLWHNGIHRMHDLGEDSFDIYHKEYLHRIHLIKNLGSWFRAPFASKRVQSFLF
jgi:hypothetical protein